MIERFDRLLAQPVNMRSLGIVRLLVGAITLVHLWPFVKGALRGETYQDHFYHSYVTWYPDLPEAGYAWLLVIGTIAAFAMAIGLWSHVTTRVTFAVVAYNLFLSTTNMHNNRAYLVIVLALLAMAPCGRAVSVDAWLRVRRRLGTLDPTSPAWPLWLLRFECATVYGASGLSKLLDRDWFSGTVTWGRLVEQEAAVRASLLPWPFADLILERSFHAVAAKLIIATELFIASGLWWPRTRRFALMVAVVFHVMIQFTADVEVFSYLGVAVLFVWADPAVPWLRVGRRPSPPVKDKAILRATFTASDVRPRRWDMVRSYWCRPRSWKMTRE
ncbi:MAG: HTTM domain-containing protein [Anaerolineaceae bacterium]